jgi:hypothetical protein
MRERLIFILILIISACGSTQKASETSAPVSPEWVQNRPISSMYYVGIGVAQKTPGASFQRTAKENALSDLASEINVNVNTNSLLYTLEREYKFEQEFRESIRTSSNLNLEDFEIVDTWEDQNSYWVYYRLNKSEYAEKQRTKQRTAQELSLDFYAKAQSAESGRQFGTAADYYLRGLQALESFWGENNAVEFQGQSILLDNALFGGLKSLLNDQRLEVENGIELTYQNRFKSTAQIRIADIKSGAPMESVPLAFEYFGLYGRSRGKIRTNADGRAEILIADADKERTSNVLSVAIDTELLFEPFRSDPFMRRLTESLRGESVQAPIIYKPPVIFIDATEKNLGTRIAGKPLTSAIMTSLGRRGLQFANSASEADLTMTLNTDTRKGGEAQGFATSFLNVNIDVNDNLTGQNVYKVSRSDIKGVDLDFEKAGMKAYQNITRNIESELMRKLVNDLF